MLMKKDHGLFFWIGLILTSVRVLARSLQKRGLDFREFLRRIHNEPELIDQVVNLIVCPKTALREGERFVFVDYEGRSPSPAAVERFFSRHPIPGPLLDRMKWTKIPSCARINEMSGRRVMRLFVFSAHLKWDEVAQALQGEGYRAATEKEGVAFAMTCPQELPSESKILALGTFVVDMDGQRRVLGFDRAKAQNVDVPRVRDYSFLSLHDTHLAEDVMVLAVRE